ncbi:hypothetical protein EDB86DRAFT_3167686 [Lactarius hatsudake]|nr:hypothetical protein EDB86DRAFT_3167686 [Lactarius hatsudake]
MAGETDDWSSRAYGPKREEHSRFKGVCYSTSLAGVNDYGATNKRSADSPSRRVILLRSDPVLTVVTSKPSVCLKHTSHPPTTTLGPAFSHKPPLFWKLGYQRPPRPDHAATRSPHLPSTLAFATGIMSRLDSLVQHSQSSSDSAAHRHPRSDRGSPRADSDDGKSYTHCRTSTKMDDMPPEDTQLTSQALNSDGTPRRPMNAFMIFARRRRPQVSAANQTMRTGDISKILSKEWNSMDMADKQFYLDQAKRLKETFNSKYPDYVYRRRPNNSRKKRRPDATATPLLDPSASGDVGDDFSAGHDFDYQSVDGQDLARDLAPSRGSSHSGVASGYDDNSSVTSPHHALSSFGYSANDFPASQAPSSGTRLRHLSVDSRPPTIRNAFFGLTSFSPLS